MFYISEIYFKVGSNLNQNKSHKLGKYFNYFKLTTNYIYSFKQNCTTFFIEKITYNTTLQYKSKNLKQIKLLTLTQKHFVIHTVTSI